MLSPDAMTRGSEEANEVTCYLSIVPSSRSVTTGVSPAQPCLEKVYLQYKQPVTVEQKRPLCTEHGRTLEPIE